MSGKRKDKRGRVLQTGESQDKKTGRYKYTYYVDKKKKNLYAWRLNSTDPYISGKPGDLSLREKIAQLKLEQERGRDLSQGNITVLELVKLYTSMRANVRNTTKAQYGTVINLLTKDPFGSKKIKDVRTLEAMLWLKWLQTDGGKRYSSIHTIRGVLRPAFRLAVREEFIPKNPFDDFELQEVLVNDSVRRTALTPGDERRFLEFVKKDKHFCKYYDGIYILLNTGIRISEFCGLTIKDLDFRKGTISISRQLLRVGKRVYIQDMTKTESGVRVLPMEPAVKAAFKRILAARPKVKTEPVIDGVTGFLVLDKNGNPSVALHWEHYFQHICEKHNKIYQYQLPKITPHVCRHTYCSKKAKAGMNPVHLAYLMGHSPADTAVTLGTYTHIRFEDAVNELKRIGTL